MDSTVIPATHWLEGGLIGGTIGGVGLGMVASFFCDSDSGCDKRSARTVEGAAIGALLGFGIGALIGGQVPKP